MTNTNRNKDKTLVSANKEELPVINAPAKLSPIAAMQQAKAAGFDVAEIKEMLALQKEYEANEARKELEIREETANARLNAAYEVEAENKTLSESLASLQKKLELST